MSEAQARDDDGGGDGTTDMPMDDDGSCDHSRDLVVDVAPWTVHLPALDAFRLCAIACIGTFGGLFWTGIEATEIRAALLLARIPRGDWTDVAADVHYMGAEVAAERNRRAKAEADRRKR